MRPPASRMNAATCSSRHQGATHDMSGSCGTCKRACASFADGTPIPCTSGVAVKRTTCTGSAAAAMTRCTTWCPSAPTTTVPCTGPIRPSTGLARVSHFPGAGSTCGSLATRFRHNEDPSPKAPRRARGDAGHVVAAAEAEAAEMDFGKVSLHVCLGKRSAVDLRTGLDERPALALPFGEPGLRG